MTVNQSKSSQPNPAAPIRALTASEVEAVTGGGLLDVARGIYRILKGGGPWL